MQPAQQYRAYSVLETKAFAQDADYHTITGVASTPAVDSYGDIVDPLGAEFATPMPLLWQHAHREPVGNVTFAKPQKDGIPFEAKLPIIKEPGRLKERVDEAIHSLRYNLVRAVSIGFVPVPGQYKALPDGGIHFLKWKWIELSLVTIGANSEALINTIKSYDATLLRQQAGTARRHPGVSGTLIAPGLLAPGAVQLIPKGNTP